MYWVPTFQTNRGRSERSEVDTLSLQSIKPTEAGPSRPEQRHIGSTFKPIRDQLECRISTVDPALRVFQSSNEKLEPIRRPIQVPLSNPRCTNHPKAIHAQPHSCECVSVLRRYKPFQGHLCIHLARLLSQCKTDLMLPIVQDNLDSSYDESRSSRMPVKGVRSCQSRIQTVSKRAAVRENSLDSKFRW
jgi:hypothetical protein